MRWGLTPFQPLHIPMIITQVPITLILPPSKTPRADGIHLSSIIRCIAMETGILKTELKEDISLEDIREITDPTAILRIAIGLAWEEWYIPQIPEVIDHPGELELDGIHGNPDGEELGVTVTDRSNKLRPIVHEIKATYKSIKTVGDFKTQWMWLSQIMGYCKMRGALDARAHVLFLCGDYKYPITPSLGPIKDAPSVYEMSFTQEEIDDNWEIIRDYKDKWIKR